MPNEGLTTTWQLQDAALVFSREDRGYSRRVLHYTNARLGRPFLQSLPACRVLLAEQVLRVFSPSLPPPVTSHRR